MQMAHLILVAQRQAITPSMAQPYCRYFESKKKRCFMNKVIRALKKWVLFLLPLLFFSVSQASPILRITPQIQNFYVPLGGTALVTYLVENRGGITLKNLHYLPSAGLLHATVSPVSTCGNTLAKDDYCYSVLLIHAPSYKTTL